MYSKNTFTLLLLISSVTTWSFAALGDIAGDRKIVTSKAYVDTKQVKIPATTNTYTYDETNRPTADGSVVTTGASDGTVGERGIATAPTYDANDNLTNDSWLPTMGAMMNAIDTATNTLSWTATETTAAGNYSTTFDGTTGNWPAADADKLIDGTGLATALSNKQNKIVAGTAGNVVTYSGTAGTVGSATVSSAATYTNDALTNGDDIANITAVETKQDKIVASDILLLEENGDDIRNDIYTPSIVTHDSNDETLVGTQFGILSNAVIDDADIGWEPPYLYGFSDRDDLVPTVAAITPELDALWDRIDNVYNDKQDILTKQLYTDPRVTQTTNLTPAGGETIDIQGTNTIYSVGRRYITGGGSQALTTKRGADTVLSYVNGTKLLTAFQTSNFGASGKLSGDVTKNNAYIRGALVSLELLKDTYAELDRKISDAVSAIDFDTLTWDTAETAAANAYSTTFSDSGTNTWPESDEDMVVNGGALANALSLKQNKITTGLVLFDDKDGTENDVYVPALVATDSTGSTINGNTIGIVGGNYVLNTPYNNDINGNMFQYVTQSEYDNFVPTLKTLGWAYINLVGQISNIQTYPWTALEWSSNIELSIDRYYTDTSSNHWPAGQNKLINSEFIALALAKKQNKLTPWLTRTESSSGGNAYWKPIGGETIELTPYAYNSYIYPRYITAGGAQPLTVRPGADNVILYVNGTKTIEEFEVSNFDYSPNSVTKTHIRNALVSLELLKDVYSELNTKIAANSRPTGTAGTVATYNGVTNGVQQFTETAIYDTANAYNATNDANKLATAGFVETKQNKIGATSDGTNNTPNYVYNATTNPTADGSVVTTTTTQGVVSERGIATAPVSDGNGGYSNGDWLPTVDAMMNAISSATPTISGTRNTIANYDANGALGSGIATYDGSGTYAPATDAGKIATAAAVETKQDKIVAGTAGNVVTYTGTAGSVGSATVSSAATYTNDTLQNGNDIANITAVETKQNKIAAGTSGNVVTYTGTAGSVGSATVSSAATYTNNTLQNGNDIANITAVETKVSKTQSTGYQVLTTGTNGTVTTEYISVPVTTSGTGRPTSTNAPTGTAAIWIE